MELSGIHPPQMNWDSPAMAECWTKFKQHADLMFEGPLSDKTEAQKVSYLLLWVGEKGRDIFLTFTFAPGVAATADAPAIPAESNKSLDTVYRKFKEYVTPKSNVIFARYKFYNRVQGHNEPVDQFVTDVKLLVKDCGYPSTIEDEIVRDRLVYGTNSQKVREKFISRGSDLNLKSAIDFARAHESAMAQLKKMSGDPVSVDGVKSKRKTSKRLAASGIQCNSQTAKSKPTGKPTNVVIVDIVSTKA